MMKGVVVGSTLRCILLLGMSVCLGCSEESTSSTPQTMDELSDMAMDPAVDGQVDSTTDMATQASPDSDIQEEDEERIGFEIIEIQSPNSIRAWISPDITLEEFTALEVPRGWIKNQPRESAECRADTVRFIRSPDASMDGEILIEEHFGFDWFHAATITDTSVAIDDGGILRGVRVRKFHEITFEAGRCMVVLISPEGEVYYRVGRDANRTVDTPTLPEGWRVEEYVTPAPLVIELFEDTLVIRTDNEDSFQGPVPSLRDAF